METNKISFKGMFEKNPVWQKILLFIFNALFFATFFTYLAVLICKIGHVAPESATGIRITQLISSTGLFILTPLCTIFLTRSTDAATFFKVRLVDPRIIGLGLLAMFVIAPCISQLGYLNEQMHLPSFLHGVEEWMRRLEDKAGETTIKILTMNSIADLIANLIVIGLIPAIGEELTFRGYLQQSFEKRTKNPHMAIWLTAFIFSAFHLQFYGFIPRFLLGALLGYLFIYGRSMIVNIFCHFMNNAVAIVSAYIYSPTEALKSGDLHPSLTTTVIISLLSLMMTVAVVLLLKNKSAEWEGKQLPS